MKVLLRNTLTNQFYQGPDQWTPDEQQALDLKQTSRAVELIFDAGLEHGGGPALLRGPELQHRAAGRTLTC